MTDDGPLALVVRVAKILDELAIPYALGGSLAASFFGEPRATADVDVAIQLDGDVGEALLARVRPEFYVPLESARDAIRSHQSFNLIADEQADALLHLIGGLVGEGHGQNPLWRNPAVLNHVGQAMGKGPRLARPGAGEDKHRPLDGTGRLALFGVEIVENGISSFGNHPEAGGAG